MTKYKGFRTGLLFLLLGLSTQTAKAVYPVNDAAAIAQLKLILSIDRDQLAKLGSILGYNQNQLEVLKAVRDALGNQQGSGIDILDLNMLETRVRAISGLEHARVTDLFKPTISSAFLGKSFAEWKETILDPSELIARMMRERAQALYSAEARDETGNILTPEKALANYIQGLDRAERNSAQLYLSLAASRLLSARLLEAGVTQAAQIAVLSTQNQKFNDESAKNLTAIERSKLMNNQETLSTQIQLQSLQQQVLSASVIATQLDAQGQLLEMQVSREEVDRANNIPVK